MFSCDFLSTCQNSNKKKKEKIEKSSPNEEFKRKESLNQIENNSDNEKSNASNTKNEKSKNSSNIDKLENNLHATKQETKKSSSVKNNLNYNESKNDDYFKTANHKLVNSKYIIPVVDDFEDIKSSKCSENNQKKTNLSEYKLYDQVPNSNSTNDQIMKRKKSIIDEQLFDELKLLVKKNKKMNRQQTQNNSKCKKND